MPDLSNIPCSATLRRPHAPHDWQPQPGMNLVHCPGHRGEPQRASGPPAHTGGNAEDCPRCTSTSIETLGYPWICPGPEQAATPDAPCLFCRRDDPDANWIIAENGTCFARWDNYPATPGHAEIVPKRHVESFFDLTPYEITDAHRLLSTVRKMIDTQHRPDGYTIGINEGQAAGRTIHHLHIHLIPRRHGDVPDPRGGIRRVIPGDDPDRWTAASNPAASLDRIGCDLGCDHGDPCGDCVADMAPELTAEEARALADELGTDLYRAQDALAFVAECCDIADRNTRPITTADVREWLKGARCGRQLAADGVIPGPDDTDLTEQDIDRMMTEGTPVQIIKAPLDGTGETP
ncbi:HIT domain-containing protein [Streptomyces sp. NPDC051597]|uniref:HIT family protein n=1 Tax=Streptomyces sp. NPDC051597 TaxID=3155049 RepID=UPI00342AAB3C